MYNSPVSLHATSCGTYMHQPNMYVANCDRITLTLTLTLTCMWLIVIAVSLCVVAICFCNTVLNYLEKF